TGRHPTTQLAVRLMLERVRPGDVVVDAGCGSGVLALAAIVRGARSFAFDADAVAVRVALDNLSRNGVRAEAIVHANQIPKRFPLADLIVANIDAPALAGLAKSLAANLKRGAALISSGVTARNRLELLAAFALAGLRFCSEHRQGVWFAYVHEKP
ncbi:MAG: 50S ribosomal protein L11 methyltransferase, partial [Candidatus Eremiobacteraeota bacterium]|nr:50S ribosomal protein L11 methyltransferase [Candidatus Eremiobacteraeota bacterium]